MQSVRAIVEHVNMLPGITRLSGPAGSIAINSKMTVSDMT